MIKRSFILFLVFICFKASCQELTATLKTDGIIAPGKDFTVEITVNKKGVDGFIRYFQELPAGFMSSEIESRGGNFTSADGAKIIWMSPPMDDQFIISYKISVPPAASGTITLGGKFSYIVHEERKIFELAPLAITIGGSSKSVPLVKENPKPVENKQAEPEVKRQSEEKQTETKKEPPIINTSKPKTPVSAAPVPGRTYRIQIGAFTLRPKLEGVSELSTVVLDNGMTKYFTGDFKNYEDAKKRREEMVKRGFQGSFIVIFENGKIIK
jgi:hypothetical protein